MKFEVYVTVKTGYKPLLSDEMISEWSFILEAPNRATADRMATTILDHNTNIVEWDTICIDE